MNKRLKKCRLPFAIAAAICAGGIGVPQVSASGSGIAASVAASTQATPVTLREFFGFSFRNERSRRLIRWGRFDLTPPKNQRQARKLKRTRFASGDHTAHR
jgi:hypothetical protein